MPNDEHQHDDDASDGRGHAHGHTHGDLAGASGRAFAIGIALNFGFVIVEGVYGFLANSIALIADAGHNLSDVLALAISWVALMLTRDRKSVV